MENSENDISLKMETNNCSVINKDLPAIQHDHTNITISKPIYVNLCVLDLSKPLLYRFHYENVQVRVGDNATKSCLMIKGTA